MKSPRSVEQVERQSSQPSLKAAVLVAGAAELVDFERNECSISVIHRMKWRNGVDINDINTMFIYIYIYICTYIITYVYIYIHIRIVVSVLCKDPSRGYTYPVLQHMSA